MCIGLVLSLKAMNNTVLGALNFVHPKQHETIGEIKDIAAGAILIAAITSLLSI